MLQMVLWHGDSTYKRGESYFLNRKFLKVRMTNLGLKMELSWSVSISHGKNPCGGNLSRGEPIRPIPTIDGPLQDNCEYQENIKMKEFLDCKPNF